MRTYFESNGTEHKVKEYLLITTWDGYDGAGTVVLHEYKTADEILDLMDLDASGCVCDLLDYHVYDYEQYENPADYKEVTLHGAWHDFDRPLYMYGEVDGHVEFEGWATDC